MSIEDGITAGALLIRNSPNCPNCPKCGRKMAVMVDVHPGERSRVTYVCIWCDIEIDKENEIDNGIK